MSTQFATFSCRGMHKVLPSTFRSKFGIQILFCSWRSTSSRICRVCPSTFGLEAKKFYLQYDRRRTALELLLSFGSGQSAASAALSDDMVRLGENGRGKCWKMHRCVNGSIKSSQNAPVDEKAEREIAQATLAAWSAFSNSGFQWCSLLKDIGVRCIEGLVWPYC